MINVIFTIGLVISIVLLAQDYIPMNKKKRQKNMFKSL